MKQLAALLSIVSVALCASAFIVAQDGAGDREKPAERGVGKDEIPKLPPNKLPPRTRPAPDPGKSQFRKSTVFVDISEEATPSDGRTYRPVVPVVRNYLAEYFRRSGYTVTDKSAEADFVVEGTFATQFEKELTFKERIIGWKFRAEAYLHVVDKDGRELETHDVPEVSRINVKNEKSGVWDIRRFVAHRFFEGLFKKGKVFANRRVVDLIAALTVDPFEAADPLSGDEVVTRLADIGLPAVPYLIDALTDTRAVMVDAQYPGLEILSDLKVYHLADKVLEEIFQKVSRMGLQTPAEHRFLIIRGWENEWRRYCQAFRESPEARRAILTRKSPGAVSEGDEKNIRRVRAPSGQPKKPGKGPAERK